MVFFIFLKPFLNALFNTVCLSFLPFPNRQNKSSGQKPELSMREMGLEPTRAFTHKILSLACLPIPALPHPKYFSYNERYNTTLFTEKQALF